MHRAVSIFFFFNDTATTEIYTLSLHDALPISAVADHEQRGTELDDPAHRVLAVADDDDVALGDARVLPVGDRKSTRLNSSHANISYAVFCLKKKKARYQHTHTIQNRRSLQTHT